MSKTDKWVYGIALGGLVLIPTANILSSLIVDGAIAVALFYYINKLSQNDKDT